MNSTALVVIGMGVVMILTGTAIARLSKKERGAGIAFAMIGALLVVGYFIAPDHAPRPGDGSPTPEVPFSFPAPTQP